MNPLCVCFFVVYYIATQFPIHTAYPVQMQMAHIYYDGLQPACASVWGLIVKFYEILKAGWKELWHLTSCAEHLFATNNMGGSNEVRKASSYIFISTPSSYVYKDLSLPQPNFMQYPKQNT